jgi:hypothetical protein
MIKFKIPKIENLYTFKQSLTRKTDKPYSVISDQFIWRTGGGWSTHFELVGLGELFATAATREKCPRDQVRIVFFNKNGQYIGDSYQDVPSYKKISLNISELIDVGESSIGTFSVFHPRTPETLVNLGCSLTERGYVSYAREGEVLRSFIHGNYDAIASDSNGGFQSLTGVSILRREYCLQYCFNIDGKYETIVVNTTPSTQSIIMRVYDNAIHQSKLRDSLFSYKSIDNSIATLSSKVPSRGLCCFLLSSSHKPRYAVFESNSVMLRPVVFHTSERYFNVFHG